MILLLGTDEAMSPFLHFIPNEVRHPLPLSIRGTGAEEQAFNTRAYRMHPTHRPCFYREHHQEQAR